MYVRMDWLAFEPGGGFETADASAAVGDIVDFASDVKKLVRDLL